MKYVNELIYKQDAIDALYHVNEYNSRSIKAIKQLPPAELERQKGKWIYYDPNGFKCSKCGSYLEIACGDVKMNFCPNCGVIMEGE